MEELVSIVVPIYNVEKFIHRCIDSILQQSYKNTEIILVDDGSPDNCPKICDEYSRKDSRIKVLHKKNGGLSDARNAGIRIAKGKYIAFVDSDDSIEKDYIKQLYNTIRKADADISACGHTVRYENGRTIPHFSNNSFIVQREEALERVLYDDELCAATWAKLYKTKLFKNIKFPKGENFEDSSTTYKLILESNKVACDMKSQYNYLIRSNSIMTTPFSKKDLLLITSWDNMGEEILKIYPHLKNAVIRGKTYARISVLRRLIETKQKEKWLEKELRTEILAEKTNLLNDEKCPRRDKIAVILLLFGILPFKISWKAYCVVTGRVA